MVAVGTATYVYVQRGIAEWVNNWGRSERGGEPEQGSAMESLYLLPWMLSAPMPHMAGRAWKWKHAKEGTGRCIENEQRDEKARPFSIREPETRPHTQTRHHPKAGVQSTMHQPFAPLRVVSIKVNIPIDLYLESKLKTQLVKLLVLH